MSVSEKVALQVGRNVVTYQSKRQAILSTGRFLVHMRLPEALTDTSHVSAKKRGIYQLR